MRDEFSNDPILFALRAARPAGLADQDSASSPMAHRIFERSIAARPASRSAQARDHRRASRGRLAALRQSSLAVASVLVVVLVAGAALVLTHGSSSNTTAEAPTSPASRTVDRNLLIASLGVLRRPQTPADLNPQLLPRIFRLASSPIVPKSAIREGLRQFGYPKRDRTLVRVVHVPQLNANVSVTPFTYQPRAAGRPRTEAFDVDVKGPGIRLTEADQISTDMLRTHGVDVTLDPRAGHLASVIVVPDGVARVRLGKPIPEHGDEGVSQAAQRRALRGPAQTAIVHDNIAAFNRPAHTSINDRDAKVSGRVAVGLTVPMTWYGASGKVIRQTHASTGAFLIVHRR
jgi:hypothetical protein